MSRLDERLERDLNVIADRATPSPDAWQSILTRVADQEPIQESEVIMLVENQNPPARRWALVAAAAAVIALVVGVIALVNRGDGEEIPADDPPAPTVAEVVDEQGAGSDVSPLPAEGEALPPGRYAPFTLGLPVTFEVPEASSGWTVQVNDDIAVTIGPEGSFVNLSRLGSLYDAAQAEDPDFTGLGSIPPDDIDAWIEANGMIVDDSREITVGGRSAKLRQVRAPEGAGAQACPPEIQPCVKFSSASADQQGTWDLASVAAYGPLPHTLVVVELDDFEPLGIWVHTDTGDAQEWLDEVQPLIDSIELGDPAPATELGTARLSTFDAGTEAAGELPSAGATLDPGRYTSDWLGVPIEFDLEGGETAAWSLLAAEPGSIWMISEGSDAEFVAIGRLGSWYDAVEARTEDTTGLGSIPPDDIDSWITRNGIVEVDNADVEVGGRSAAYRRFRLDTAPGATADFCGDAAPCLWAATGSADVPGGTDQPIQVGLDRVQSIWLIEMGEFEPVYVFAAAQLGEEGDQEWFTDVVQPIIDSIELGEPAPVVPGGTARVPERVTVTSTMNGVRTEGAASEDGTVPVESSGALEGDLTGELVSSGTRDGNRVVEESVFAGDIAGLGSGTLTFETTTEIGAFGEVTITSVVSAGTDDLAGLIGWATTSITSNSEPTGPFTATFELEVAIPRPG